MIALGLLAVILIGLTLLFVALPGGIDEVCWEDGCARTATHERFEDMVGDTPRTALVCRRHGGWRRS
jgi:hypothetical protein